MTTQQKALSIDQYLGVLPAGHRAALEQIRSTVHAAVPGLTERISYGIPTFDLDGHYLVYMAAWKAHVSLYPVTPIIVDTFGDEIAPYVGGKGTLKFTLTEPIPLDLVRRIAKARAAEAAVARTPAARRARN
jgi:uncharacterized protein YdhG (YjbR/CyaY superfamily)